MDVATTMRNSSIDDGETGRIGNHGDEAYKEEKKQWISQKCPLDDQSSLLGALLDINGTEGPKCLSGLPVAKAGSMRRLMATVPSERSLNPESGWNTLDSVHSSKLDWADASKNDSYMSMSTSSSSFASFGESGDEVVTDLASKEFTTLTKAPTPRAVLMKQHSLRLQRGSSYRGTLSLIEETNLD